MPDAIMSESTDSTLPQLRAALADVYEIEASIGRGGMGHVYLARERRLERRVAIKVLPRELASDPSHRRQFLSEARTVAALTHPNIVPIFAVEEIGDFVFFAMAYVAGETLSQRVATRGPLDAHQTARLLSDVGEALGYAHARGVVHRDVKPDNILLDAATGRALLSDFGIAHTSPASAARARLGRPSAPGGGRVVGTAAFISPEQAQGDAVDARSDLYSLGVVAFYALSGRLPFYAATDIGLLALHISEPAPPLASVAPYVPPRFAQIIDRCLAKEAWARFPDAAALVRAVVDAVEPLPIPLAVRAFLIRGAHLEGPALIHTFITGAMLLPATVAAWLSATQSEVRGLATAALATALIVPFAIAISRIRRLLAAGHDRGDLVAVLAARQARRREELTFVYGPRPSGLERAIAWLSRLALLGATAAVAAMRDVIDVPLRLVPLLPAIAVAGAATALLAGVAARARTEERTDPRGERRLRFWRGPVGRWLFRLARVGIKPTTPIVTILGSSETPA
jgi:eukaryotic-like serine/threonine-protein kinase